MPAKCQKHDIEQVLVDYLKIKNAEVYDYPADPETDGLLIACAVIVGIWVGVLVLWSAFVSFREPVENELIKKDEEVSQPNDKEERVNSLVEERVEKKDDYKLFNFYEGYCRVFKRPRHKHILGSILFLATLSIIFST
jgi:hypothetical protein